MTFLDLLTTRNAVFRLVGVSFNREAVGRLSVGERLVVLCEDDNPHDPFAMRVQAEDGSDIGFLPSDLARRIRESEEPVRPIRAVVTAERTYEGAVVGVDVRLELVGDSSMATA